MRSILVAVDGSEGSKRALRFAVELSRQTGAMVHTLTILEPPTKLPFAFLDGGITLPTPSKQHADEVEAMVQSLHNDLPRERLNVMVKVGRPAELVNEQAEVHDVDLIVMGARGLASPAVRLLVGSVTEKVLRQSQRPVTVVP